MDQSTIHLDDIPRLVALANRCEADGHLNLNKLLEAVSYAKTRRAGWSYRPGVSAERLLPELKACLKDLEADGLPANLNAVFACGLAALSEGRKGDMLAEEAPDVFVCRVCGEIAVEAPPQACPTCGAWSGQFRKFVAIFHGDNTEPANPFEVLALLAQNAKALQKLVTGLTEEELDQTPFPGEWSLHAHIAHFYDTQEMLDQRVELMLKYDDPQLAGLSAYAIATEPRQRPPSARATLDEFCRMRATSLSRLEALPLKELWRTGRHAEFGRITILRQAAYLAYHEQTHLPDIKALQQQLLRRR